MGRLGPFGIYLIILLLGAVLSRGLAPYHWIWVMPGVLAALPFFLARLNSAARWAMAGWAFGLGYFMLGLSWILEPFQVDAQTHGWMAPFALFLLAGGLALFWALAFWCAARLSRDGWSGVLALTVTWGLAEFARAYVFTGFPWAGLAQIWIETPVAGLLSLIGPHGVAAVAVFAGLSIGQGLRVRKVVFAIPFVAVAGLAFLFGQDKELVFAEKTVRLIQPNAPQHQKWDPDFVSLFFQRQIMLTTATPDGNAPDLVVWPETSVPVLLEYADEVLAQISEAASGAPVLVGIQSELEGRYYNTLAAIGAGGEVVGRYDKHHLVPFGEYVPFETVLNRLGLSGLAATLPGGFSPGPGAEVMEVEGVGRILPLICYEAVFPQDVNAVETRPDLLVQVTNDAWFGAFSGPYQHLVQARMRAVEQGVPMVRAANTGISAMIDPNGNILNFLPLGQAGFLDAAIPKPLAPTVYSRTGDWPVFVLMLVLAGLMYSRREPRSTH